MPNCQECGAGQECITGLQLYRRAAELLQKGDGEIDNSELAKRWCPECKMYTTVAKGVDECLIHV